MDELRIRRAKRHMQQGLAAVAGGNYQTARDHFKAASLEVVSADTLTYWGWMEHHLGNTTLAIELCQQAIQIDPDFGNPYNDIGSYLMAKGEVDDAITWLKRAVVAKRYEPRHFPHINLGRAYLHKKMPLRAIQEFNKALAHVPNDPEILQMIRSIRQSLN